MGVRDIITDKDPLIRKTSRVVVDFDEKLGKLIDDMWETMRAAKGCGLAAVQVAILRRAAVAEIDDFKIELINPVIEKAEGGVCAAEGCLSVPGESGEVIRPEKIKIKYRDRNGKPHTIKVEGWAARVCCHEIDHMDGVLYVDKLVKKDGGANDK